MTVSVNVTVNNFIKSITYSNSFYANVRSLYYIHIHLHSNYHLFDTSNNKSFRKLKLTNFQTLITSAFPIRKEKNSN